MFVSECVEALALTHTKARELTARTQAAALLSQGIPDPGVPALYV